VAQRSSVGSRAGVSFAVAKVASLLLRRRRRRRRFSLLSVFPSVVCCENPSTSMQRLVWLLWCVDEVCRYGLLFRSLFCFLDPSLFFRGVQKGELDQELCLLLFIVLRLKEEEELRSLHACGSVLDPLLFLLFYFFLLLILLLLLLLLLFRQNNWRAPICVCVCVCFLGGTEGRVIAIESLQSISSAYLFQCFFAGF
jgi:hypothetical protein